MQLLGYQTDTINFATEEFSTQSASRDNSVASPKSSKKMRHSDDVSNMSKVGTFDPSSKELKKRTRSSWPWFEIKSDYCIVPNPSIALILGL